MRESKDTSVVAKILELQLSSYFSLGIYRMQALLLKSGIHIGHNKVARLMSENALNAQIRRPRANPGFYAHRRNTVQPSRPNVLNREFHNKTPGTALVCDTTSIRCTGNQWLHLAIVAELRTGLVVSYQHSLKNDGHLVTGALNRIRASPYFIAQPCLLHSDQGSPYTSEEYTKKAISEGFQLSYSRRGNCWDNAPAENFFSHLKAEMGITHSKKRISALRMRNKIDHYIDFYCNKRIQARLGYKSPADYLSSFMQDRTFINGGSSFQAAL